MMRRLFFVLFCGVFSLDALGCGVGEKQIIRGVSGFQPFSYRDSRGGWIAEAVRCGGIGGGVCVVRYRCNVSGRK